MLKSYAVGDLVHIPQSVELLDCDTTGGSQLTIPLRVKETASPTLGVITEVEAGGYLQVYCEGVHWAVKPQNVYRVEGYK